MKTVLLIVVLFSLAASANAQEQRNRPQYREVTDLARIVEGDVVDYDIRPTLAFWYTREPGELVCETTSSFAIGRLSVSADCRLIGAADRAGEQRVDLLVTEKGRGEAPVRIRGRVTVYTEQPQLSPEGVFRFRKEDRTLEAGALRVGEVVTVTSSQGYFYDQLPGYFPGENQVAAGCPTEIDGVYATLNGKRIGICGVGGWTMFIQIPKDLTSGQATLQVFGLRRGKIVPSNVLTLPVVGLPSPEETGR